MRLIQKVTKRFLQASAKSDFDARLLKALEESPEAIDEGILEGENASQRAHHNEPYETIEEFKQYDHEGYQRALERTKDSLLSRLGRLTWGKSGPLVFRALALSNPNAFLENLQNGSTHVGIYWSFSRGKALPYWSRSKDHKVLKLEAELPPESIDFPQLIKANTTRAFSQDEDEITALENKPVLILNAYLDDNLVKVNQVHRT